MNPSSLFTLWWDKPVHTVSTRPPRRNRVRSARRAWQAAALTILAVGAFLRLYHLGLIPMHSDEGVNGMFLYRLIHEGFYQYNPTNFHGPTLYFVSLPFVKLNEWVSSGDGLSNVSVRLVPAFFGIATIALILSLKRFLGRLGALTAATLMAISPGAVYLDRYYIHETLLVFFTFAFVTVSLAYLRTAKIVYFMAAAAAAALMFATKETAAFSAAAIFLATAVAWIWVQPRRSVPGWDRLINHRLRYLLFLGFIGVFLFVSVLFYSSFFSNRQGPWDAIRTFSFWTRTSAQVHIYPWHRYVVWSGSQEATLMALGLLGAVLALWRRKNAFAIFAAVWALVLFAIYSLVPYKTPWLMLNFMLPFALTAGYAVEFLLRKRSRSDWITVLALFGALTDSGYRAVRLTFFHYDDDRIPYVYSHSHRELQRLVDHVEGIVARHPNKAIKTAVLSPEHWPLPWYFRNDPLVTYHARIAVGDQTILIVAENQEDELKKLVGEKYVRLGVYTLRPTVRLLLYIRP